MELTHSILQPILQLEGNKMKYPLYIGSLYFLLMSLAHITGVKIPGLFIYFNIPSYSYQDKIISHLLFGWSLIFFYTAKILTKELVNVIIIMSLVAICVLTFINLSTQFSAISNHATPLLYHIQVGLLTLYLVWLIIAYKKEF